MNDGKVDDMGGVGGVMFGFEVICGDSVLAVFGCFENDIFVGKLHIV